MAPLPKLAQMGGYRIAKARKGQLVYSKEFKEVIYMRIPDEVDLVDHIISDDILKCWDVDYSEDGEITNEETVLAYREYALQRGWKHLVRIRWAYTTCIIETATATEKIALETAKIFPKCSQVLWSAVYRMTANYDDGHATFTGYIPIWNSCSCTRKEETL